MSQRVRIVLADDHVVLRVGLRAFLEEQEPPRFEVVGEAGRGDQAITLVEELRPDLLLLDLAMPGLGGLETTIELRRRGHRLPILVLTQYAEAVYLRRLLEAGATGYILKSARGETLVAALEAVLAGGTYVDPSLAGSLVHRRDEALSDEDTYTRLSPREQQVLKLIAQGLSNKEIAQALEVAVKTVMAHRANLMDKLDIHNLSKLIHFAIRLGVLPCP